MAGDHGSARNRGLRRLAFAALAIGTGSMVVAAVSPAPLPTGSIHGVVGVTGVVSLADTPPAASPVDMGGDDYCTTANAGQQVLERAVVTDVQGHLANVIVYVKEGLAAAAYPPASEPAVLDQRNCFYEPRVVALRVDQPIIIRNSDATLHNVHVHAKANKPFNLGQPMRGVEARRSFAKAESGIHVACDVHGWMTGTIAVFEHPFFGVTGANGGFTIDALPAGEYVIEAWHETLGTQQQRVTVGAGAATEVSFSFGS